MLIVVYSVTVLLAIASNVLNVVATVVPKWLISNAGQQTYGLFLVCSGDHCRPYPRADKGDCEQDNELFCPLWQAAGAGMILAGVVGALTLVALLGTLCSSSRKRERGWKLVAGMMMMHAVPSAVAVVIMIDLEVPGTYRGPSVTLALVAWSTSALMGISILYFATRGNYGHRYEQLTTPRIG
ncbi:hypothetical protein BX666DRAFT_190797 [Dichotomocladium elegans]|nr:hypothetical protein BX666DRAFT_190797 [Dichotomocladium elegans]